VFIFAVDLFSAKKTLRLIALLFNIVKNIQPLMGWNGGKL